MAFYRSKVLSHVQRFSTPLTNPVEMTSKNLKYDASYYGPQYMSEMTRRAYEEEGRRFLNRIPRYRGIHPEIKDAIDFERTIFLLGLLGVCYFASFLYDNKAEEDKRFYYRLFKDKEFVGRYSYKEKEIEYHPRLMVRHHT